VSYLYFAGSFNPIHHGHLIVARAAAEQMKLEGVTLLPSAQNPLKADVASLAGAEHRLAMCRLAVEDAQSFRVNDLELRRAGPSFTIDTVRLLRQESADPIYWLIGADQVPTLPMWREIESLMAEAHLVIAKRPGFEIDWSIMPKGFESLRKHVVETALIDISATEIRARVRAGLPINFLTPAPVIAHIQKFGLYT